MYLCSKYCKIVINRNFLLFSSKTIKLFLNNCTENYYFHVLHENDSPHYDISRLVIFHLNICFPHGTSATPQGKYILFSWHTFSYDMSVSSLQNVLGYVCTFMIWWITVFFKPKILKYLCQNFRLLLKIETNIS